MVAPASLGASSRTMANAASAPSSRVPLSMEKLCRPGAIDGADQNTSSGPNPPTSSAEVSSAPVRSSARSLKEGMQSESPPELHVFFLNGLIERRKIIKPPVRDPFSRPSQPCRFYHPIQNVQRFEQVIGAENCLCVGCGIPGACVTPLVEAGVDQHALRPVVTGANRGQEAVDQRRGRAPAGLGI